MPRDGHGCCPCRRTEGTQAHGGSMSRWTRFIPVVAVGFVVAACGVDPVGTDPLVDTLTPRMDAGYGTGANATGDEPDGTTTTSSTSTTEETITIPTDSTSRGGYGTGGN